MSKLHSETVASYVINNKQVDVVLCWQGKEPEADKDRFYDLYDNRGNCLNEGEPWHDDGEGVPSEIDVREGLKGWLEGK
tara:strand:- start:835 stop:1071 length:237 start_codon:yes stop_codon:yes gene_type:complete